MEEIINSANHYKYSSLQYVDAEDISDAVIHVNTNKNIFLYQKSDKGELYWESKSKDNIQLFWASKSKEDFFHGLAETMNFIKQNEIKTKKLYMEFIPEDFLEEMNSIGFKIVSEWVDFWNNDLSSLSLENKWKNPIKIRKLNNDEISIAADVTRSCAGCSRGFTGESDEVIKEWDNEENACLFAAELDNNIVGICFARLYGFNSEKGTILWIRELAVNPKYHSKGIGRELITRGIKWGIERGAKRSFLACDAENINAIKLYESLGYKRKNKRGQINMEY